MSASPRSHSVVFATTIGVAYLAFLIWELPPGPSPSDDALYIDAAAKISHWEYTPPSAAWPFHHYLRWPVVLSLALLFRTLGYGPLAMSAFSALHLSSITILTYFLVLQLSRDWRLSAAAAVLGIALLPVEVLPSWRSGLLIRSELPSLAWTLAALLVLAKTFPNRSGLLLAGSIFAIAVNATHVTLFFAPAVLVLLLNCCIRTGHGDTRMFLTAAFPCVLGFLSATASSMALEGLLFGDPLIQTRVLGWWQMLPTDHGDILRAYLDPSDRSRFALGFLVRLWNEAPSFVGLIVFAVASAFWPSATAHRDPSGTSRLLVGMACASFFSLELSSPFVIEKTYFRFATVPCYFFGLAIASELFRRWRGVESARGALVPLGASTLAAIGMLGSWSAPEVIPWLRYYRDPIELIRRDAQESGADPSTLGVYFENPGVPGLIPWGLATNVYGGYFFRAERVFPGQELRQPQRGQLVYYVQETDAGGRHLRGFGKLDYPEASEEPRPRVWRSPVRD